MITLNYIIFKIGEYKYFDYFFMYNIAQNQSFVQKRVEVKTQSLYFVDKL